MLVFSYHAITTHTRTYAYHIYKWKFINKNTPGRNGVARMDSLKSWAHPQTAVHLANWTRVQVLSRLQTIKHFLYNLPRAELEWCWVEQFLRLTYTDSYINVLIRVAWSTACEHILLTAIWLWEQRVARWIHIMTFKLSLLLN